MSHKAVTIRLVGGEGLVSVMNAGGAAVSVRKDMRLMNGYTVSTGKESSAYMSLDSEDVVLLEAEGQVKIEKSGRKLEVTLVTGKLTDGSTNPNKPDLNIRTSTMVLGIRG